MHNVFYLLCFFSTWHVETHIILSLPFHFKIHHGDTWLRHADITRLSIGLLFWWQLFQWKEDRLQNSIEVYGIVPGSHYNSSIGNDKSNKGRKAENPNAMGAESSPTKTDEFPGFRTMDLPRDELMYRRRPPQTPLPTVSLGRLQRMAPLPLQINADSGSESSDTPSSSSSDSTTAAIAQSSFDLHGKDPIPLLTPLVKISNLPNSNG